MTQPITTATEWHQILLALPNPHVLQSWPWGDFKSRWGWTVTRLAWFDGGQPVAAAQILRRPIPRTGWSFLYITKGPILDYRNEALTAQVLTDLATYARRQRALFIKIDPDVPRRYGEPDSQPPREREGQTMLTLLKSQGWHYSPEQIQFRNTVLIDLTPDSDTILARMKSKWRYNIRLAERRGVVIEVGDDLDLFYTLYAATAARDGFLIRPKAYYLDVWHDFLQTGQGKLLLASVEGEVVAGMVLFIYGQTAWYFYGASTEVHRQHMPNHLLQWQAMLTAKESGCTRYDMWGAPDTFSEVDSMWGVYRFKRGFGGTVRQGLGAFDYPVHRWGYWAFTTALPQFRALLRRLS